MPQTWLVCLVHIRNLIGMIPASPLLCVFTEEQTLNNGFQKRSKDMPSYDPRTPSPTSAEVSQLRTRPSHLNAVNKVTLY